MADGCCSDYHFRMTTDFGFILKDICARADADRIELIALSDIARWTGKAFNPQTPDTEFLNELSLELARQYSARRITYELADAAMNDLFRILLHEYETEDRLMKASICFSVFEAFDAGEYHRRADKSDNPVAEHTDPEIEKILKSVGQGS